MPRKRHETTLDRFVTSYYVNEMLPIVVESGGDAGRRGLIAALGRLYRRLCLEEKEVEAQKEDFQADIETFISERFSRKAEE